MNQERDDLEQLVRSPGWISFKRYADQRWTNEIDRLMSGAVGDPDDTLALNKMRQVIAAKKAVEQLLAYPEERIKDLAQKSADQHAPLTLSRRGGL
jgi:hypothetical protein